MKRFRRWAFNAASFVSVLLFGAAAVFAARGVWWSDWVSYSGRAHAAMVASIGSSAWVSFWLDAEPPGGWAAGSEPAVRPYFEGPPSNFPGVFGLAAYVGRTDPSATSRLGGNRPYVTVIVPHWMLAAAAGVLPALWLRRRRRAAMFPAGCCRACGYDLRATPGRCPECGTVPERSTWAG